MGDEFWKKCNCRKHLRWTHNGKQHRKKAGTRSWAEAEEKKRKLEAQYEGKPATAEKEQQTIARAVELFLASKTSQGIDAQVVKKYHRELDRLTTFCEKRSKLFVSEILLDDLVEFRTTWDDLYPSSATRQQVQTRLRGFLRYCYDARWIDRIPRLSAIQADEPPTLPFNEKEYQQLLAALPEAFGDTAKAKRVRALVQLNAVFRLGYSRCSHPPPVRDSMGRAEENPPRHNGTSENRHPRECAHSFRCGKRAVGRA